VADSTNFYVGARLYYNALSYDAAVVLKLPVNGNLLANTSLNFTLSGNPFIGTLTGTALAALTINSTTTVSAVSNTTTNTARTSSSSTVTISTTATSLVNHNQQLV
jgi:hypothetical protein